MLTVTVAINGVPLHVVDVLNTGPPPGVQGSGPTGPRVYRWRSASGESGELIHWREDGAAALAGSVLRQLGVDCGDL